MIVISLHDQQVGEVHWEADSRDMVMHDGKNGCSPSERKEEGGRESVMTEQSLSLNLGSQLKKYRCCVVDLIWNSCLS